MRRGGFTLIELLVVMAIIATLLAVTAPRYFGQVERSKETVLRQTLVTLREAIDKYYGDTGRYPDSLEDLVARRYLRAVPNDPIADSTTAWVIVPPPDNQVKGAVYDVKSGATGNGRDGVPYREW